MADCPRICDVDTYTSCGAALNAPFMRVVPQTLGECGDLYIYIYLINTYVNVYLYIVYIYIMLPPEPTNITLKVKSRFSTIHSMENIMQDYSCP